MQIGDKIRFLNSIGGGEIVDFQGKDVVIVRDEDGFEVPTPRKEVVVVGETTKMNLPQKKKEEKPLKEPISSENTFKKIEYTKVDIVESQEEEDVMNVFLGFQPENILNLTATDFNLFLVNNSNYYLSFTLLVVDGKAWKLKYEGRIEPHTKIFLESVKSQDLKYLERICLQALVFRADKPFFKKKVFDVEVKIDLMKLNKLHSFRENAFFDIPNFLLGLIKNGKAPQNPRINSPIFQKSKTGDMGETKVKVKPNNNGLSLKEETLVVDLQTLEIAKSDKESNPIEVLNAQIALFHKVMQENIENKNKKIVFVHGKGEGILRQGVIAALKQKYNTCKYQDASFLEYNFGATLVIIA